MRLICMVVLAVPLWATQCIEMEQARDKIGATTCVAARVLSVTASGSGTHYLNFCPDYQECPFTVVVFARDLRQVGDVRQLEGKLVEVHGHVQLYHGQPEIILRDSRQLRGESANIPPLPKDYDLSDHRSSKPSNTAAAQMPEKYDVQRHGKYRAGKFSHPKSKRKKQRPKMPRGADSTPDEDQ